MAATVTVRLRIGAIVDPAASVPSLRTTPTGNRKSALHVARVVVAAIVATEIVGRVGIAPVGTATTVRAPTVRIAREETEETERTVREPIVKTARAGTGTTGRGVDEIATEIATEIAEAIASVAIASVAIASKAIEAEIGIAGRSGIGTTEIEEIAIGATVAPSESRVRAGAGRAAATRSLEDLQSHSGPQANHSPGARVLVSDS